MVFHEIRFPAALSFGSLGGPERRVDIVTLVNGFEQRNSAWSQSRRRYDAGVGLRSLDDLAALISFFEARGGQLHAFRWKDWADFKSCLPSGQVSEQDQFLGLGDGQRQSFALRKAYASGAQTHWREVKKPVQGTVRVALDGRAITETLGWVCDYETGGIWFDDPVPTGVRVSAGFEFDVPVRFDTGLIQISVDSFEAGELPSVPVVEVRL